MLSRPRIAALYRVRTIALHHEGRAVSLLPDRALARKPGASTRQRVDVGHRFLCAWQQLPGSSTPATPRR
ncbi:protein of unknown function [Candidatus Hydrogenisulfobacillus filiaventi]|uniref:Uncharacterized protein n=1 Tax=Candidatus Hydrogenisulfobacillus filiaventi TaxID=2707344 RepID=A0A6F8ZG10_9FIRM|nr:protein of unknown function [Candidatus Hydrogenisulfobacillus filiaventi]